MGLAVDLPGLAVGLQGLAARLQGLAAGLQGLAAGLQGLAAGLQGLDVGLRLSTTQQLGSCKLAYLRGFNWVLEPGPTWFTPGKHHVIHSRGRDFIVNST